MGVDRLALRLVEHHPQPQTGRAAAVTHAFPQVKDRHFIDRRCAIGGEIAEIAPDVFPLAALLRHHDQHLAVWFAQQLAVEQVRGHGVVERNPLVRHFHAGERDIQTVAFSPQRGQHRRLIDKRLLMVEQHMAIADRDDVVMKHAAIDSLRRLAGQTPCSADPADAGGPPLRWPRGSAAPDTSPGRYPPLARRP